MSSTTTSEPLGARIALYSIAATGLASGAAYAEPTESGNFPVSVTVETEGEVGDNDSIEFDIDGDGIDDFSLWAQGREAGNACPYGSPYGSAGIQQTYYGDYSNYIVGDAEDFYYAAMITEGTTVDGTEDKSTYSYLDGCWDDFGGNFQPPSRGYIGFSFYVGDNEHFGYFDVETAEGSLIATIHSACYESTPGVGIEVGACAPPVDEPPADDPADVNPASGAAAGGQAHAVPVGGLLPISLGVLALGATALHRRRRQQR